jgi:hypothetical protein
MFSVFRINKQLYSLGKLMIFSFLFVIGILFFSPPKSVPAAPAENYEVFLPLVIKSEETTTLLGVYPQSYWKPNDLNGAIEFELDALKNWSGKQVSLGGIFHSIDQHDDFVIDDMFQILWDSGYTPFVNIYFNASASAVASGAKDADIRAWAREYKKYADNGSRMAFLAPMQEMNGNWVPYGSSDPAYYIAAYQRIWQIFDNEGVPAVSVQWVFAPNGLSSTGFPPFEAYYPGDDYVDVVAFSSYNFGYHPNNPYKDWETPEELFVPFIDRMRQMAPVKPVVIAQTGTTTYGPNGYDKNLKNQWFEDAYQLLSSKGVLGVIYYNAMNQYDWAFYRYDDSDIRFEGYCQGISHPQYKYISPAELFALIR